MIKLPLHIELAFFTAQPSSLKSRLHTIVEDYALNGNEIIVFVSNQHFAKLLDKSVVTPDGYEVRVVDLELQKPIKPQHVTVPTVYMAQEVWAMMCRKDSPYKGHCILWVTGQEAPWAIKRD